MLANAAGIGAYFARSPNRDVDLRAAQATPSWRLETGASIEGVSPKREISSPTSESLAAIPVLEAAEQVTPAQLQAANRLPCPSTPRHVVSVRDFGARGDGRTDDTSAIQKANNAVAVGGGRVVFPAGTYRAYGVNQDSCVEFAGQKGAMLIHPDGISPKDVVKSRLISTTGSIGRRSRVLTVNSTRGLRPGVLVAIQGAGGKSRLQRTSLQMDAPPYVTTITVRSTKGLNAKWTSYLFVGDEIISYTGISGNVLNNVRRGLFGTTQASHRAGDVVAQAQRMYAVVVRISGKLVTLDSLSWSPVRNAQVSIGAVGMSVVDLTIDGHRRAAGSDANPFPLKYELSRWVSVRNSTLRNGDHGGVVLDMGTRDSVIEENLFVNHGDSARKLGSAIWLFRGASHNVVRENTIIGNTFVGVTADDRTIDSSEFDADSNQNTIERNTIDIPSFPIARSAGIFITGTTRNRIFDNIIRNAQTGIMVHQDIQGVRASEAVFNRVGNNTLISDNVGILVTGSDNEFLRNVIRHAATPTKDGGDRNRFTDNIIE